MNFFDLHCDTIYECILKNKKLNKNNLHISLERGRNFNRWVQCFAIWLNDKESSFELENFVFKAIDFWSEQVENNPDIIFCKEKSDLKSAFFKKKIGAILCVENLSCLEDDLLVLDKLYEKGVRLATLTWNGSNKVGAGALTKSGGLTVFGKYVLIRMLELGLIVDISHASDHLFYDVFSRYSGSGKVMASHSNSRKICNHPRNLTDEQFITLKSREGVVGLTFCKDFLRKDKKAQIYDILHHAEHFLELGGEEVISIGSDFDGADMPEGLVGIESIYDLYEVFLRYYQESLVEAIFFKNAYNFFYRNLK
ncbi:MAG: membrane dipeptidase [Oscillospiraceae bacterium]|jgi:membrane dipeptidase|nr:membrane dipeptidase [Oscillospiraceae bacterium]